jgi:hypothetical protein
VLSLKTFSIYIRNGKTKDGLRTYNNAGLLLIELKCLPPRKPPAAKKQQQQNNNNSKNETSYKTVIGKHSQTSSYRIHTQMFKMNCLRLIHTLFNEIIFLSIEIRLASVSHLFPCYIR